MVNTPLESKDKSKVHSRTGAKSQRGSRGIALHFL